MTTIPDISQYEYGPFRPQLQQCIDAINAGLGGGTVTTTGAPLNGNLTKFSGASSITSGNLSGDVTTAGALVTTIAANAITTAKLANANVTLAKIANAGANSVLVGAGAAGAGAAYSEITLGAGLTMTGTVLSSSASGGVSSFNTRTGTVVLSQADVDTALGYTPLDQAAASFAGSAAKWTTARTLSFTGDATGTGNVDGSANVAFNLTIAAGVIVTASITNAAVTLAKIQNAIANSKVIGAGAAGAGSSYSELSLGANLSVTGTTINATSSLTENLEAGAAYAIVAGDNAKVVDMSNSAGPNVTVPQAGTAGFAAGFFCYIKANRSADLGCIITPTTSLINGQATYQLNQGGAILMFSDGTDYQVIPLASFYGGTTAKGYSLQIPNNAIGGGAQRGTTAVDLQLSRSSAAHVASGVSSFAAGFDNTASGQFSVSMGNANDVGKQNAVGIGFNNFVHGSGTGGVGIGSQTDVSGANGVAIGTQTNVTGQEGIAIGTFSFVDAAWTVALGNGGHSQGNERQFIFAGGRAGGGPGSSQWRVSNLFNSTSGAAAVRLTADGGAASASNVAGPTTNSVYTYKAEITIYNVTQKSAVTYSADLSLIGKGVNNAATVMGTGNPALVAGPTFGAAIVLAAIPTITADTTNGGFNVSYTPPVGNTDTFRAVCRLSGNDLY